MPEFAAHPLKKYLGATLQVVIDRPLGSRHPDWDLVYPCNYGHVPGLPGGDGEPQDAYILGVSEPLRAFEGVCIAIVVRLDDDEDKLVLAPQGLSLTPDEIQTAIAFQERFFHSCLIVQG